MLRIKSKKSFFQDLKSGTLLCENHRNILDSGYVRLFEFGHLDEESGKVYWQTAIYYTDSGHYEFTDMAAIRHDGKLFEQKEYKHYSDCSNIRLANELEKSEYYDALDCKYTWQYCQKLISKQDLYVRPIENSERLSRLRLAVNPPEYLYVKTGINEMIFKTAPLTMKNASQGVINYKEMIAINDEARLCEKGKIYPACDYNDALIREATDSERKLLIAYTQDRIKKELRSSKMSFGDSLKVSLGTMLYASENYNSYIFPYGGHVRIEGSEILCYSGGCLKMHNKEASEFFVCDKGHLTHYSMLSSLRMATDEEVKLYNEKKLQKEQQDIDIARREENIRTMESRMRPFVTKVLVSNGYGDIWRPAIFGCFAESGARYIIVGGQQFTYCVLYSKYRNLIGKKFNTDF